MDVKTAMKAAGLGNSFQRMSVTAVEAAIKRAEGNGEGFIKRGTFVSPLVTIKAVLARVQGRPVVRDPHPDGEDPTAGDEGLAIERDQMPDTPKGYVTGDFGGPGGEAMFARVVHRGSINIVRNGVVSVGVGGDGSEGDKEMSVDEEGVEGAGVEEEEEAEHGNTNRMITEEAIFGADMARVTETTANSKSGSSSLFVAKSDLGPVKMKRKLEGEQASSYKRTRVEDLEQRVADPLLNTASAMPSGGSAEERIEWLRGAIAKAREEKRQKADKAADLKYNQIEKQAIETLRAKGGRSKKEEEIEFANEKEAKEHVVTLKKREQKRRRKKANEYILWLSQRAADRLAGRNPAVENRPALVYRDVSTKCARGAHGQFVELSLTYGNRFDTFKRGTHGFTVQNLVMPAADTTPTYGSYPSIGDFRQGELVWMLGHHLMWTDSPRDQFSSYTNSPIFVVTHALGRAHTGRGGTTIQFLDRRKAFGIDQKPAKFYPALKLYDIFEVPTSRIWVDRARQKLHARKFTQEYLSHHTVRLDDTRFQQARIEILIRDGLFDIFPAFEVDRDRIRAGLYTSQVVFRKIGFPPTDEDAKKKKLIYSYGNCSVVKPITNDLLEKVKKVTLNFMLDNGTSFVNAEPHLHAFLTFLCFEKRPRKDPTFIAWIKAHYKAGDVIDLFDDGAGGVQPGFTDVANNLPDVMQFLDLVRDACDAFGLAQLPDNVVHTLTALSTDEYEAMDIRRHQKHEASKAYDRDARDNNNARRKKKTADEQESRAAGLLSKGVGSRTSKALETADHGGQNGTINRGALAGVRTTNVSSQAALSPAGVEADSVVGVDAAGA
ncbi:hypothetical protein Tdes44962_MAKER00147 [Teratosphaeria destructans]|uniref:Uncharacterized protein n=1 Tax=Teratosphaeria destructans TaxID=418781 RepID=A0A9W7T3N3_9PEZI|nr:hypothetical protein Tdes44962_MAKER00147 [Teratosphaeria destructans]